MLIHQKSLFARSVMILGLLSGMLGMAPVPQAFAAPGDIARISVSSTGTQGNGSSGLNSISADGRYVAFDSFATNLILGDTNAAYDVFLHDRQSGETRRISVSSSGTQGNGSSTDAAISGDGRYIIFRSAATNLVSGDTNGRNDLFLHDQQTGSTTRVSVDTGGVQGNGNTSYYHLSDDGRYIVFGSTSNNLVADDTNAKIDVFLRDTQLETTVRISADSTGVQGNGDSDKPFISADGRYITYHSYATNLLSNDTNARLDVFVYDQQTGITTSVSVDSSGTQGNHDSFTPSISADGRYVAFGSAATNLVSQDTNAKIDIFVHDRETGVTTLVSRDSAGLQTNASSYNSMISADGRFITFNTAATNLVSGDTNGVGDVFLYDRRTGQTIRVSTNSAGAQATGGSSDAPTISSDARFVAFDSSATNLIAGDTNASIDAFVRENDITVLPVAHVVNKTADTNDGICNEDCSLREAISASAAEDTINFDPSLAGQTITMSAQLSIDKSLTIDGSGLDPQIMLSGGGTTRIMQIGFDANVTLSDLTFMDGFSFENGGAIAVIQNARMTLKNSTLHQNFVGGSGGAISTIVNSRITILNSTFHHNQAGGSGGAIYAGGNATNTVIKSTFSNNRAAGDGGAVSGAYASILDSTFDNNVAEGSGGAMALAGNSMVTIANSTVFQNSAGPLGGAIMAEGNAAIDVFHSTFAANNALNGKEIRLTGNVALNLHNTVLVCTTGNENCYSAFLNGAISTDHSVLGIGLLTDYGLAEPADNGGPTQTMALLPGSPLIDAGADAVCADATVNHLDQRGVARPQGSHCDIGAYEDQSLVRYVKQGATGTGDGSSWANAHTDLQSALAAAAPDEEVWVAAGTYKPTLDGDRTISFALRNGVAIYGGFAGTETARSQRNYQTNLTVLSGDIGVPNNKSDNSYHVVIADHTNTSAWLDGITITGGNADDDIINTGGGLDVIGGSPGLAHVIFFDNYATFGGGMHVTGDTPILVIPILTDVTFHANSAVEGGGLRNFEFSNPILTNVIFDGNSVTRSGGGMENFSHSNPALTNVIFRNNTAGELGAGGGMYNWVGNIPILQDVTFTGNTAQWGGGMGNYQSSPILRNVVFSGNSASWYAGGMSNEDNSNPRLTDVTFDGNTAESNIEETAAGGMHNRGSSPILKNVTFRDNSANYIGGGMVNELGSSPDLTNVTFSGNSADYGGAMLNRDANSNPTLTHVTMSHNIALGQGGAIANTGTPVITNSILWGNAGGEIFNLSGTPVVTYSIVQGGHAGTGNLDQDPLLGPLQDNGGFTQTMALGDGSPAINTAEDTNCPDTDQRGVARPLSSHCDMGAYEYDNSTVDVFIGGASMDSYLLAPQESKRVSYPGINSGPVNLVNTDDASIMAAERVIYKVNGVNTSFSEMMGLPNSQLDTVYWLPWYNNVDLDTQLRFANVSGATATVHVFIGDTEMSGSPFTLAVGESTRKSFTGINNGPVKIQSDVNIVAAERVIYKVNGVNTSFSEMMGLPNSQLDTAYWLPWYNNVDLDTQLRIANVSASPATVHVYIGGLEMIGSPFTLAAGGSTRKSFAGINNGPVKIVSDHGVPIVAAERVIYKVNGKNTSFSELMALPESLLNTVFWLPWYNNKDLDTQLRFANTTNTTATVHVYMGGTEMPGSPFTLAAGESTRKSFTGVNNGPVKIVSDVPIVAAERVIYKVNGVNTSFSELMGLPDSLLNATFWFPWYNNVDLDTQLRFGLP